MRHKKTSEQRARQFYQDFGGLPPEAIELLVEKYQGDFDQLGRCSTVTPIESARAMRFLLSLYLSPEDAIAVMPRASGGFGSWAASRSGPCKFEQVYNLAIAMDGAPEQDTEFFMHVGNAVSNLVGEGDLIFKQRLFGNLELLAYRQEQLSQEQEAGLAAAT